MIWRYNYHLFEGPKLSSNNGRWGWNPLKHLLCVTFRANPFFCHAGRADGEGGGRTTNSFLFSIELHKNIPYFCCFLQLSYFGADLLFVAEQFLPSVCIKSNKKHLELGSCVVTTFKHFWSCMAVILFILILLLHIFY